MPTDVNLLKDRNMKNWKTRLWVLIVLLNMGMGISTFAQKIPLVYTVENTGIKNPAPVLPGINELPVVKTLTDPFQWSDGSGRSTNFKDWSRRRAEIAREIEHYEIGEKPVVSKKDITANIVDDTLRVNVTVNGQTLTLKAKITYPAGKGPFPAIIGIGRGTGSLPPTIFTSRNIAQIAFNFTQVMSHTQKRGNEPINKLYPDRTLTIAQEPGGGGAAAWRVSETLGEVETLGRTSHAWFKESMFQYKEDNVSKLPYDHHELCAMVAPRALLVLGNPDYVWLADESGYVSCRAARKVWETFGIADRMGFSIVGGHGHCQLPESQYPEVEAFVDKFLLGKKDANTEVTIAPLYEKVDYERWLFH